MALVIGHAALASFPSIFRVKGARLLPSGLGPLALPKNSQQFISTSFGGELRVARGGCRNLSSRALTDNFQRGSTEVERNLGNGACSGVDRGAHRLKTREIAEIKNQFSTDGVKKADSTTSRISQTSSKVFESKEFKCTMSDFDPADEIMDGVPDKIISFVMPTAQEKEKHIATAWEHWGKLGAPKLLLAPMVDQSELPFRMLCRKYGATAAYTPMLHSRVYLRDANYRRDEFSTSAEDRPLFVQFCANDPDSLLEAAQLVESECDYVDINLGCPQRVARRGYYGAFLMDNLPLIQSLVFHLSSNLSVPVSCKIRVFPELEDTIAYARMLEDAGCSLLAVHGRTKDQKYSQLVRADWNSIRAVKSAVGIPVVANGNIRWMEDVEACMAATGADGVMSAESLLENPALFAGYRTILDQDTSDRSLKFIDERILCLEYLDMVEKYPVPMRMVLRHLFKLLTSYWFKHHADLRDELHHRQYQLSLEFVRDLVLRLIARGPPPFTPYNGLEFPEASVPTSFLPVEIVEPTVAGPYVPNPVEQERLRRAVRRRPKIKVKLPDWNADHGAIFQTLEDEI